MLRAFHVRAVMSAAFALAAPGVLAGTPPLPTTVNVGVGETYTSLTNPGGVFAAINAGGISSDTTVFVTSDLAETGAIALAAIADPGVHTITIRPSAAVERVIAGNAPAGLLRFANADRVTLDGRFAGAGRWLRFRNTATAPTFLLTDGTQQLRLVASVVEGGNASATSGTIVFGASGAGGNDASTIEDCLVRDRSDAPGVPANAIYASGPGSANAIVRSQIANFSSNGILVADGGAWIVDGNSVYQTAPRSTPLTGIALLAPAPHIVNGNHVGGSAPNATGGFLATSATFRGIDLAGGTGVAPASVQGNVVRNIRSTSATYTPSYGIFVESGRADVGTIARNTVGSPFPAERFEVNGDSYGIRVTSSSVVDVRNNLVQNMTTAPNVPAGEFYFGIAVQGVGGAHVVADNVVSELVNGSVPDAAGAFDTRTIGLFVNATGAQSIRDNVLIGIRSVGEGAPAAQNNRVWGIVLSGTAAGTTLTGNRVEALYAVGTGAGVRADVVTGIQLQSQANVVASNNVVAFDANAGEDRALTGILDLNAAGASSTWSFNSVHLFGGVTGTNGSQAYLRLGTADTFLRNNIFANARFGGSGAHVALANGNASAAGWPATASDYNLLSSDDPAQLTQWLGTGAGNALGLAAFRAASGGDAHTTAAIPNFATPFDLHIAPGSPAENRGIAVAGVTVDRDGEPRSTLAPDIGADEVNNLPAVGVLPVSRRAGDPAGTLTLGSVADADQPPASLSVSIDGGASATRNGITISALALDALGNVSASIVAGCTATDALFQLRATDANAAFTEATVAVTVAPNLPPALSYPASSSGSFGLSLAIQPQAPIFDSSGIADVSLQSLGTYTGTATVNGTGLVSLSNLAPVGTHTLVVRARDACDAVTDAPLPIAIARAQTALSITSDSPDPSPPGQGVVVQWNLAPLVPIPATPTGTVTISATGTSDTCSAPVAVGQCSIAFPSPGLQTIFAAYGGDTNFDQSSSSTPHIVGNATDLAIAKSSNLTQINAGLVQYTVVATNLGPSAVTGATLTDDLPAILTNVGWTCTASAGGACAANGNGDIVQPVDLPVGASVTFAIAANIATNPLPPSLANTATIASPASVPDSNATNDSATVTDGLLIFRNGFEDSGGIIAQVVMPGFGGRMRIDTGDVMRNAVDASPQDVALFAIGDELALVGARRIGGEAQVQVLQRDASGAWHAGPWVAVLPQQAVSLVWSNAGAGAPRTGVQVE